MEFLPAISANQEFSFAKDTILLVPSVSIGNLGQLAMELLLCNYPGGMHFVGYLEHDSVLPMVGGNPFSEGGEGGEGGRIAVNLEVYQTADGRYTLVQQRSPLIPGHGRQFSQDLMEWAGTMQFQAILVLASLDASTRVDQDLENAGSGGVRVLSLEMQSSLSQLLPGWKELRALQPSPLADYEQLRKGVEFQLCAPGGGALVQWLLQQLQQPAMLKELPLPVGCILGYCVEGHNLPESILLANTLLSLLSDTTTATMEPLRLPPSWKNLYGGPPETSLFQ